MFGRPLALRLSHSGRLEVQPDESQGSRCVEGLMLLGVAGPIVAKAIRARPYKQGPMGTLGLPDWQEAQPQQTDKAKPVSIPVLSDIMMGEHQEITY